MGCASSKQAGEYSRTGQVKHGWTGVRQSGGECGSVPPPAMPPAGICHVAAASNLKARQAVLANGLSRPERLRSASDSLQQQAGKCAPGGHAAAAAQSASLPQLAAMRPAGVSPPASEFAPEAAAASSSADEGGACPGLTSVLAHVFDMPGAAILLLGRNGSSRHSDDGVAGAAVGLARSLTPWQYRQGQHEVLVIHDLAADVRTKDSPYVDGRRTALRFYAGAWLLGSNGLYLGTLCLCDTQPRDFSDAACAVLVNCAGIAARELEGSAEHLPPAVVAPSSSCSSRRPSPPRCSSLPAGSASSAAAEAARRLGTGSAASHGPGPAAAGRARGSVRRQSHGAVGGKSAPQSARALGGRRASAGAPARRSLDSASSVGSLAMYSLLSGSNVAAAADGDGKAEAPAELRPARQSFDSASSIGNRMYSSLLSDIEEAAGAAAGEAADVSAAPQMPPQQAPAQRNSASGAQPTEANSSPDSSAASSARPSFAAVGTVSPATGSGLLSYIEAAAAAAGQLTAEAPTAQQSPRGSPLQQGPSGLLQPMASPFAAAEVQFPALAEVEGTEDGQLAAAPPPTPLGQTLLRTADQAPRTRRSASLPQPEAETRPESRFATLKAAPSPSVRRRTRLATATGPGRPLPSITCRTSPLAVHNQLSARPEVVHQASTPPPQPHTPCSQPSSELAAELADELAAELAAHSCLRPAYSSSTAAALPPAAAATASCFPKGSSAAGTALLDASAGWRLLYVDGAFAAATGLSHGSGGGGGSGERPTFWQHFEVLGCEGTPASQPWWSHGSRVGRGAAFDLWVTAKSPALASAAMHVSLRSAILPEEAAATTPSSTARTDSALAGLYLATLKVPSEQVLASYFDDSGKPSSEAGGKVKCRSIGNGEVERLVHGGEPGYGALIRADSGSSDASARRLSIGYGEVSRISRSSDLGGSRRGSLRSGLFSGQTPFPDVRLGSLLGRGSFGSVFRGWRGEQEIAVKVIRHTGKSGATNLKELEATLGLGLKHNYIVRTYDYATINKGAAATFKRPSSRFGDGRLSISSESGSPAPEDPQQGLSYLETWILLELCNAGSLQDAIDLGWLRAAQPDNAANSEPQAGDAAETPAGSTAEAGASADVQACSGAAAATTGGAAGSNAAASPGAATSGGAAGAIAAAPINMQLPLACAVEVASAMAYLHGHGITHNDLTCRNVLLCTDPDDPRGFRTKVADLGLGRNMALEDSLETHTFGTVTHMPPELLSEGKLSNAADVYSFGVMLWELYTGQRPWGGMRPVQVLMDKGLGGTALKWPAGTPEPYRCLAQECLAHTPASRPTFADVEARCREMEAAATAGAPSRRPADSGC